MNPNKYDSIIINVRAHANTKENKIIREEENYIVWVTETPENGKANDMIVKLLADYFAVSKTNISILRGAKNKRKVFKIKIK